MPAEAGIDESDEIPARLVAQAKEMGLYGYALPAEYGGLGLSVDQQVRLTIELGYTCPAFRSLFGTNNGIAGQVLVLAGTDQQRKQWLPRLASGEVVASFALTEPDAGSDPSRLTTLAAPAGRRLGHRRPQALHHQCPGGRRVHGVRPRRPAGAARQGHRGVRRPRSHRRGDCRGQRPQDGPGGCLDRRCRLHQRPGARRRTGGRGSSGRLRHGHAEPGARAADHRGPLRGGRGQADRRKRLLRQGTLAGRPRDRRIPARPGHARRLAGGVPRGPCPGARRRAPVRRGHRPAARASLAKYFASEAVGRIADRAVQIHGGSGYIRGVPVERLYRDVRLFRIYEGTSQIQQLVIAREMLR